MENIKFKAMVVKEIEKNKFQRNIQEKEISSLPKGDILVNVKYSSLNYKDALSATGNKGVTRKFPHTPGIDSAGIIIESNDENFKKGDEVIVTSYDLGMNTSGGYGQYIRVPSNWVVKLPENLTLRESMIYGTAGFTAALSIFKMINCGVKPEDGEILVTGATGGVGSLSIAILAKLGYNVIAASGKPQARDMLLDLGAKDTIHRSNLDDESGRAMLRSRWAGVIDTVGGNILSTAIKSTKYSGAVTCCGNVASHEFMSSVYPFILRGVTLCGIDSGETPMDIRLKLWALLSSEWKIPNLEHNVEEVSLEGLNEKIDMILKGKAKGRIIVNLDI
ncbi:YhdH/YhfP family quinone oxidoreductase [Clostridium sediminicola]|uniref:YhdH/YhfP family quinone oxidoreductase n=1 Tax=Clostridium sediminicola TaxID=3114879 RepID=UPI0031F27B3B